MKDCKIVQDLLPSYIEKLTSKDTNDYVEGHLKTCEDCTKVLDDMKADLNVKTTTPKAEIDYMKKVRKKMRIADKLALIVLILLITFILLYWREIFSFICYADICNKYLAYQNEVQETGKYTVIRKELNGKRFEYHIPGVDVSRYVSYSGESSSHKLIDDKEFNSQLIISGGTKLENDDRYFWTTHYFEKYENYDYKKPYKPYFSFEEKLNFWDLMSTFNEIRYIRIADDKYEIDLKDSIEKLYLDRLTCTELSGDGWSKLAVGTVSEEFMNFPNLENDYVIYMDYELPNRNITNKIDKKISNCDEEAGTVVSYDFKIGKEENASLLGLKEDDENSNMLMTKITNNITYKKFQEKWSGLRDMTDEDFENYYVILVVNKDNAKEIKYNGIEKVVEEFDIEEIYLKFSEEEATSNDFAYSANLIIIPNTIETKNTPSHIFYYNAEIVNN